MYSQRRGLIVVGPLWVNAEVLATLGARRGKDRRAVNDLRCDVPDSAMMPNIRLLPQ